jgi:hypothetical protein
MPMSVYSPHPGCPLFVSVRAARTWFERELTCVKRTLPGAEIVQIRPQHIYESTLNDPSGLDDGGNVRIERPT